MVAEREGAVLFGAGEALTNDQVLRADNAAVALRLLGQDDELVWYVPTYDDLAGDDETGLGPLLPRWIEPGLWLVLVAAVVLVIWRARRLGPLATEPLPVVVKAIETTRSRGRLYRRAGDRGARRRRAARRRPAPGRRTAAAGRRRHSEADAGPRRRPAHRPPRGGGRPRSSAPRPPHPTHDHDLIRLATDLAELDREVRRT